MNYSLTLVVQDISSSFLKDKLCWATRILGWSFFLFSSFWMIHPPVGVLLRSRRQTYWATYMFYPFLVKHFGNLSLLCLWSLSCLIMSQVLFKLSDYWPWFSPGLIFMSFLRFGKLNTFLPYFCSFLVHPEIQ